MENKDYSKLTLEELFSEEKRIKKNEIYSALAIGFLLGIMVYGFVKNGFGMIYTLIPLIFTGLVYKNSQKSKQTLKEIQAEITIKR